MTAKKKTCRIYFVTHTGDRLTGILLRRWEAFWDTPPPAAYGDSEESVMRQLAVQLAERTAGPENLSRYLWDERFEVHRADVSVYPQTLIKKRPVIGKKRIPLRLTYVACRLESGAYRVMLPRFGWWMLVEDLNVAAESLRNAVSAALLGEEPHWLYDFRREGEEYVKEWSPDFLLRESEAAGASNDEDEDDYPVLNAIAEELVEKAARRRLQPVVGEGPDTAPYQELLERYPPPSLLLVGGPGVGKSTLVRRLARLLAQRRRDLGPDTVPRIWKTSGDRIIAGMIYLGMWQERCFEMIEELQHEGDYLYFERLDSILRPQPDGASIADLLAPAVLAGEISLLAECTEAELEHYRRRHPRLINQFEYIRITELSASEMPALLALHLAQKKTEITIHPEGLTRLVHYLDLFAGSTCFPGKGFHFVDWLAQQDLGSTTTFYPGDISRLYSQYSGLPVELIADEVPLPAEQITESLGKRVIGQEEACQVCSRVLARFKARLNDPARPVGTFLFVGPTGVGKTELAKQLTRYMYGDPKRIVRLDMSEYMSGLSVQRLFEIGHGSDSLVERVRRQPLSVVLLDEIEKAHPQVFDLLLGVLGEGRLTDSSGQLVDFSMTMIIMTSNLGVSDSAPVGFGERHQEDYVRHVRQHFRPEFFNRIDHIVSFRHLSPGDIVRIVDLELAEARERTGLQRRQITLLVSDGARRMLGQLGFHPTRGARPLKRVIEEKVVTPLAVRLARAPTLSGRKLWIVKDDDEIWGRLNTREREDAIFIS